MAVDPVINWLAAAVRTLQGRVAQLESKKAISLADALGTSIGGGLSAEVVLQSRGDLSNCAPSESGAKNVGNCCEVGYEAGLSAEVVLPSCRDQSNSIAEGCCEFHQVVPGGCRDW